MQNENTRSEQPRLARLVGRCKVCTKQIRVGEDHAKVFHGNAYYLVCCASCAAKFDADPRAYLVT